MTDKQEQISFIDKIKLAFAKTYISIDQSNGEDHGCICRYKKMNGNIYVKSLEIIKNKKMWVC